jgi:two-component system OmpR family sensor kinase/two-component system sensor histidine kinase BaeS
MNRLWVQITLAFALVVLVAVTAIAILADLTAGQAFRQYLSYGDIARFENLIERLGEYYEDHGSWDGVDAILSQVRIVPAGTMPGTMMDRRPGTIDWQDEQVHLILADADGKVVYDDDSGRTGRKLDRNEQAAAQDIAVDDQMAGQLVVSRPIQSAILGPLEEAFIERLRWILVIGGLIAGTLGALFGLGLSRSLTAPLQRLATAARAVGRRDFSQRVEVEGSAEIAEVARTFNEMTSALEESEEQRQNLVADIAHELRTPLSVVQGNLRAILDDVYPLEKTEISRLYDETRLLSRLVDDLRELALADAGQLRLNLRPTATGQIIDMMADNLSMVAEAEDVSLEIEVPEDLPTVQADADRLAQVLRNLLVNALHHTPSGGTITVSARSVGSAVQVSVADTGEGIPPEDLLHVFERFWRADRARALGTQASSQRWARRSGLGLSVAESLIEAQGGRIWAESELGQGTTFHFTIPLA